MLRCNHENMPFHFFASTDWIVYLDARLYAAESSPQESHAGASPRVILAVNRYDVSSSRPEFDQRKTSGTHEKGV
jgi:hypothetical protein